MIVSDSSREHASSWWAHFLAVAGRRKTLLVLPTAAGLGIGLAGYANTPYTFVSEAVVVLDSRRVQAMPTETVVSPLPQDSPVLRTELDVIESRSMAAKVIARLERQGVAIDLEEAERRSAADLRRLVEGWLHAWAEPAHSQEAALRRNDQRRRIDLLLSRLRVSNDGRSYTIFLTYSSSDPNVAAKVANAYAAAYLDHQIESQRRATRRVSDWLGETLVNLRANLETSEQAAEDFRQEAGLVETNGATLQAQRVAALNTELAATRAAFSGMQARLETIKGLTEQDAFPSLGEILGSETIQSLRLEQARIERRLRELRDSNAVKSMEIATLGSELAALEEQLDEEVARIVESLTNEMAIARQKEGTLGTALSQAQAELAQANHAEVALAQLEREAAANRTIYESYLVRYKQTIEQDGIAAPEAEIISLAQPATAPAQPRLSAWLLFGLGFGGTVAVAATALREATDRRHRLREVLENATGTPVIGGVPAISRRGQARMAEAARDSTSALGRSLSTIRMVLRMTPANRKPVSVMVTSAFPREGKTTLILNLARSAAAAGMKPVVLDANLRAPGVAPQMRTRPAGHLDELAVAGANEFALVSEDTSNGVAYIAARRGSVAPELLFVSPRFRTLVNELKLRFDLVLIDTPDLAAAPDALDIASAADHVLFIVDFESRRMQQTIAAIRSLAACGQKPAGIVLNGVDARYQPHLGEHPAHPIGEPAEAAKAARDELRQTA